MVCSDYEAKNGDGYYGSNYACIPEGVFFSSVIGDNAGDNTKAW